jgi:hypothetical protein
LQVSKAKAKSKEKAKGLAALARPPVGLAQKEKELKKLNLGGGPKARVLHHFGLLRMVADHPYHALGTEPLDSQRAEPLPRAALRGTALKGTH